MNSYLIKTWAIIMLLLAIAVPGSFAFDSEADTFTMVSWRSVGWFSNDLPHAKTRAWIGDVTNPRRTGETGQAEQGWHELHPHPGPQTASFFDRGDTYPTIASPVLARRGDDFVKNNTIFDMVIYWPYQADVLVWGQSFTNMGQTFVADGYGLDKVSLYLMHDADDLQAVVRRDGPDGEIISPPATFRPNSWGDGIQPGWVIARWLPGQVALEKGKTYYLDLSRTSGKAFSIRHHSTGNVYKHGQAYYEGIPEPGSDLGVFLSFNREDMVRSPVLYTDAENWVYRKRGVYFEAASANLRIVYIDFKFPNTPFGLTTFVRVNKIDQNGKLVQIGPVRQCNSYASPGSQHFTGVLYGANEVPLEVGRRYYIEVIPTLWEEHKASSATPEEAENIFPVSDLNVRVYGEKTPGMTPVIFNQQIVKTTQNSVNLVWEEAGNNRTYIHYGSDPYNLDKRMTVARGKKSAEIPVDAPAGMVYFKFVLTSSAGGKFETPVYEARTLDRNNQVVTDPPLNPTPKHKWLTPPSKGFINIAKMDHMYQPPLPKVRTIRQVQISNPGFENGLDGWTIGDAKQIKVVGTSGGSSAGWNAKFTDTEGYKDSRNETIYQTVSVTPGKTYILTASLYTKQDGHDGNWYNRLAMGDLKARLVCDPKGGTSFDGHNSTQWFRTDGQWLQFAKTFKAESNSVTIGAGFMRGVDWPGTVALVDEFRLVEIAQ